jgi:hypothetical protein
MLNLLGPKAIEQLRQIVKAEYTRLRSTEAPRARWSKRGAGGTCNIQRRYVCSGGNLVEQWRDCSQGTTWTNSATTSPPDEA